MGLLQDTEIIFQYEIKLLFFTTHRKFVHCMVQIESWIVIQVKFSLQRVKMDFSLCTYDSDTLLLIQHSRHTQTYAVF